MIFSVDTYHSSYFSQLQESSIVLASQSVCFPSWLFLPLLLEFPASSSLHPNGDKRLHKVYFCNHLEVEHIVLSDPAVVVEDTDCHSFRCFYFNIEPNVNFHELWRILKFNLPWNHWDKKLDSLAVEDSSRK